MYLAKFVSRKKSFQIGCERVIIIFTIIIVAIWKTEFLFI